MRTVVAFDAKVIEVKRIGINVRSAARPYLFCLGFYKKLYFHFAGCTSYRNRSEPPCRVRPWFTKVILMRGDRLAIAAYPASHIAPF